MALYYGNLVLGRVALREGKLDEAKNTCWNQARRKGSPVLNSFGPNMSLAKELLEKGETNAVLEFFQECEKFWPSYGGENKIGQMDGGSEGRQNAGLWGQFGLLTVEPGWRSAGGRDAPAVG